MADAERIYFDSNIFISLLEEGGEEQFLLREVFSALISGRIGRLVTSALTLSEVLVHPFRARNAEMALVFETWLAPDGPIDVVDVDRHVLRLSAMLRAERQGLKTPDAIHLASAITRRCSRLVTADQYFRSIDSLDATLESIVEMQPLAIIRPDIPTLTSLLQSLTS